MQGGAVKGGTGKRAIIIVLVDQAPSFVRLAFDIGFTGLALGVEGIELEVQVMFGGFSRVRSRTGEAFCRAYPWSEPRRVPAVPLGSMEERLRFGDCVVCGGCLDCRGCG